MNGLFITGTDTNVGKTYIGTQIVALLHSRNISVVPRKPIESGCEFKNGELQANDAKKYFEAVKKIIPLSDICSIRFQHAISPKRAAQLVNKQIGINDVKQACLKNINESDFLVVEGAGGFYSPLCEDGLNSDLAKALQLPVLLIANDQLGCINHILLTAEAIHKHGLHLCGVILNSKNTAHDNLMNNYKDLETYFDTPIYSISNNAVLVMNSPLLNHITSFLYADK